uniref:Uncharacterized protein n=1 Tax=Oryza meridionalis TaxID=40149 RepID=A0A0E0C6D7_9ORYZ
MPALLFFAKGGTGADVRIDAVILTSPVPAASLDGPGRRNPARSSMVPAGAIPALALAVTVAPTAMAESALGLLVEAAHYTDDKAAIGLNAVEVAAAMMGRMIWVGPAGCEFAVGGDGRMREAVALRRWPWGSCSW